MISKAWSILRPKLPTIVVISLALFGAGAVLNLALLKMADQGVVVTGSHNEIVVVAREPGPDYDVLAFCSDPDTNVTLGPAEVEVHGENYLVVRGLERVDWKDSPVGQNPVARRYYIDPQGVQHDHAVEITKAAEKCIKSKVVKD